MPTELQGMICVMPTRVQQPFSYFTSDSQEAVSLDFTNYFSSAKYLMVRTIWLV